MDKDGNEIFMPCSTHEEYEEIVNPQDDDNPDGYGDEETEGSKTNKKIYTVMLTEKEKANLLKAVNTINQQQETENNTKLKQAELNVEDIVNDAFKSLQNNNTNKEV